MALEDGLCRLWRLGEEQITTWCSSIMVVLMKTCKTHKIKKLAVPTFFSFLYRKKWHWLPQGAAISPPGGYMFREAGLEFTEGLLQVAGPPHSGVLRIFYHPLRIMMLMIYTETPRVESWVPVPSLSWMSALLSKGMAFSWRWCLLSTGMVVSCPWCLLRTGTVFSWHWCLLNTGMVVSCHFYFIFAFCSGTDAPIRNSNRLPCV